MHYELVFRELHAGRVFLCAYLQLIRGAVPHKLFGVDILNVLNDVFPVLYRPCKLHDADALPYGIQHVYQHLVKVLNPLELLIYEVRYLLVRLVFREWLHLPIKPRHSKLACLHL